MSNLVIGICGGSGSGKTTLASSIKDKLGDKAVLISMDNFYKFQPNTTYEQRSKTNYDHPSAFDTDIMVNCLKELKENKTTKIPIYDFTIHNRSSEPWMDVKPAPIIIIEGVLLFAIPEAVKLLDRKIFVDTAADLRLIRRMERDMTERARSFESIKSQYLETVRPMHLEFVEPFKAIADVIVPEEKENQAALDMLIDSLIHK